MDTGDTKLMFDLDCVLDDEHCGADAASLTARLAAAEARESTLRGLLLEACVGLDGARFAVWLQEVLALIGITPDEHARMCGDLVRKRTEGS